MAFPLTLKEITPKLRIVKPKAPGADAVSAQVCQTTRVTASEHGINLNRPDSSEIRYADLSLLVTFQLDVDPDTWYVDLFVYGQSAAFRLPQKAINYRQFLPEVSQRSKDNFYNFLLYLINQTDSVYVDEQTLNFLKSKKMTSFPDFKLVEEYAKQLWFQIISWMKFRCGQCGEIYWVDNEKVAEQGAKTKCVKCQNIITVKKRAKPVASKAKEERKTIPCPHCRYENSEGNQFCTMCQKPLRLMKPAPLPEKPAQAPEAPLPQTETPPPVEETRAVASLPLQARASKKPYRPLRDILASLQDDVQTLENKFAWFSQFIRVLQILGFVFLVSGVLAGAYLYFGLPNPRPSVVFTATQRLTYAGISTGVGFLLWLACIVVSNIIAVALEIERNTKVGMLLLQKLVASAEDE